MSRRIYLDFNASTPICPESNRRDARDRFWEGLRGIFGEKVTLNGHPSDRLPNTIHVNFVGRIGAEILAMLPGVAATLSVFI